MARMLERNFEVIWGIALRNVMSGVNTDLEQEMITLILN